MSVIFNVLRVLFVLLHVWSHVLYKNRGSLTIHNPKGLLVWI